MILKTIIPLKRNVKKPLLDCLKELKIWLSSNFLNLNKNEIILFRPKENCFVYTELGYLSPYETYCTRNLGVPFDHNLNFDKQISTVEISSFIIIMVSLSLPFPLVQNAAARLLTGTRKYEPVTPILIALH